METGSDNQPTQCVLCIRCWRLLYTESCRTFFVFDAFQYPIYITTTAKFRCNMMWSTLQRPSRRYATALTPVHITVTYVPQFCNFRTVPQCLLTWSAIKCITNLWKYYIGPCAVWYSSVTSVCMLFRKGFSNTTVHYILTFHDNIEAPYVKTKITHMLETLCLVWCHNIQDEATVKGVQTHSLWMPNVSACCSEGEIL